MKKDRAQKVALTVTRAIGSPASLAVHTVLFIGAFLATRSGLIGLDEMLLVLTTIVSLEAIYLSIFIQMTINYTTQELEEVGEDIDEIQEDIDEIQEDVGEIQEDVDELQEDVEDMTEEEKAEEKAEADEKRTLDNIQADLRRLIEDVEKLRTSHASTPAQSSPSKE